MRIIVLGGTQFIGRAIVGELDRAGHQVLVVHRGQHEPEELNHLQHLHVDRGELEEVSVQLRAFQPEGAIDVSAMNGHAALRALRELPEGLRLVAISSGDVYRAFSSVHEGIDTDSVPLSESSPVRSRRLFVAPDDENLEVEEEYLARGGIILRLGAVYGEHDYQRRHEFVLRRVRAGRPRIPIGRGNFLFSRCYVGDVAVAVRLAIEGATPGEVFNVAEGSTWSTRLLAEKIIHAAGTASELVTVSDAQLPSDLRITGFIGQQLLLDSHKLSSALGWVETDPEEALRLAVSWELAQPLNEEYLTLARARLGHELGDFSADDIALSTCVD